MTPLIETKVLDHGLVALMRVDGDDMSPATAARTSYGKDAADYTEEQNAGLTDYLIRHHHSTPVEFCGAVFYMVMPIFVARQMIRHRTASVNESSMRYVEATAVYYVPALERMQGQSKVNKQGSSSTVIATPELAEMVIRDANDNSFTSYKRLLELGLSRELARSVLPLGIYTTWYWKANLRNILHLLWLRCDGHAQYEIRVYADAMLEQLRAYFPNVIKSWENHTFNAVSFSADELGFLKDMLGPAAQTGELFRYPLNQSRMRELEAKIYKVVSAE